MKITRRQLRQIIKEELSRLNEGDLPEGYRDPLVNVGDDYSDMTFEEIRGYFKSTVGLDMQMTPQERQGMTVPPKASGRFLVLRRADHADLDTAEFKQFQTDRARDKQFRRAKAFFFIKDDEKYFIVLEMS